MTGQVFRLAGAAIARHPSLAGGTAAFAVIFSFVAANAVWYQPGAHPSPLVSTRDRLAHMARAKPVAVRPSSAGLTIDKVLAASGSKTSRSLPQSPDTASTGSIPVPSAAAAGQSDPLIADIQKALADRQFYHGPFDGHDGGRTRAAIEAFQAATARPLTGEPTPQLLAAIEATHRNAVAIPRSRPNEVQRSSDSDVIASLASLPSSVAVPAPRPRDAAASATPSPDESAGLVARIQTGLHNIAYSDVSVDGVAGARTRAAIRNFEKNYRLPVTGEPNKRVLAKLVAIGAL